MKFKNLRLAATLAAIGVCSTLAQADDGPEVKFSGFGTLGFVTTNSDTARFRTGINQHTGATKSDTDWGVDSRLGVQANVKLNDTFSLAGQVLARRNNGEFAPEAEWLYGQAKVNDNIEVRLGRLMLPVFMVSDFRNVGYATHALRAPQEVYGLFPASHFDGVQGVFRHSMADTHFMLQLSAGKSSFDLYAGTGTPLLIDGNSKLKRLYSVNLTAEHGNWLGRIGYTLGDDTRVVMPLAGLDTNGKDKFMGLGLQYDNGTLLVMGEYTTRRWTSPTTDKAFDSNGYYLSAGYRFGSVMPYISTSTFEPKGAFFTSLPSYAGNGKTNAVGVRWDFMKNMAFKAQVEETKGTGIQAAPISADYNPHKKLRAISAAVDFVF